MKKILSLLLIFVLCVSITPTTVSAAVKINKAKATMEVGSTLKLKVTGTSSNATWTTSKKTVATVNSNGIVTAKSEGQTTIAATVSRKKYICKVTVKNTFNAEKAIENIDASLNSRGKGVIAILENNYEFPMSLSATILFYDSNGTLIGKSEEENYCFEAGKKCVLFFSGPYDGDYNNVKYDRYEILYSADEVKYVTSNLSDIKTESNFGVDNVMVKVTNNGKIESNYTQVSVLFYNDGVIVGCEEQYAEVTKLGSVDYLEFSFPYDDNYETVSVDNFEVYVNYSY